MAHKGSLSARKRREEMRQKRARRNRLVVTGVSVVALLVIVFVVWRPAGSEIEPSASGTVLSGERPLAAIEPAERNNYYTQYPSMIIDTDHTYEAIIVTEKGDIRLRLFDDEAPMTVNNFVFLATQGFYDGTTFHRVLTNFMAQGGDPSGTGRGGPGYHFEDEVNNGFSFNRRGLLAMANAGSGTNGSQFFLTFAPAAHLNNRHTIFGELVKGDDVLSSLTLRDPTLFPGAPGDTIERIDIIEVE